GAITVQAVLQLAGAVEEDSLFRLCDAVVDRDTAGALLQIEELAEQGQDIGRLVGELLEHLRHLLLVQHLGHVPDSLPVTEETRDRLREQANQLPEPTVLRLVDLLAVALEDLRQGGVGPVASAAPAAAAPAERRRGGRESGHEGGEETSASTAAGDTGEGGAPPALELTQLQEAWQRSILPAVRERSIPVATLLGEARPVRLEADVVTLEFAPGAEFHRRQVDDPKHVTLVREALYDVTGHHLDVVTTLAEGARRDDDAHDEPLGEKVFISLLQDQFDAREVEEP